MKNRIIFHIDLDAFYTSVEEVKNPKIKNQPVVVGQEPKEGKGRGVVSTCNYIARKYGVHSGQPISIAWRKLQGTDAVFLPVNMDLYQKVSAEIMEILSSYSDKYEQASVDEIYLDVTDKVKTVKEIKQLSSKIKNDLIQSQKLTCSIGVGPNKMIAKIAANVNKPDGLIIVKPKDVKKFLSKMSVRKILGIGPKSEEALNSIGVKTISQLASIPQSKLEEAFGKKSSAWMHLASQGIDESQVEQNYETKSVGRQYTFQKDTDKNKHILEVMNELIINSLENLNEEGYKTYQTITVKIRYSNFETHTSAKTLKEPHSDKETALKISTELLKTWLEEKKKIRLVGISFSKLR